MSNQVYVNQVNASAYYPNIKARDVLDVSITKVIGDTGLAPKPDLNPEPNTFFTWPLGSLFGIRWDRCNETFVEGPKKAYYEHQSTLTRDSYALYEDNDLGYTEGGIQIQALKNTVIEIGLTCCYKKNAVDKSTFFVVKIWKANVDKTVYTVDNQQEGTFVITRSYDFTLRLQAGDVAKLYFFAESGSQYGTYYDQRSQLVITKLS